MKIADIFWISNDKWDAPVSLLCNFIAYGASAGGCYFKVCKSHHEKVPLVGSLEHLATVNLKWQYRGKELKNNFIIFYSEKGEQSE